MTGTNPINSKHELRVYHEGLSLNTPGDVTRHITTIEHRTPIFGGKWQFRIKERRVDFKLDSDNDGMNELSASGFGDLDFRFLTVPVFDKANMRAFAVGLEVFLNTASDPALGSGANSIGPQIFGVFFKPFGGLFDLIAPAYQHKISVQESRGRAKVNQGFIDLFALKMSEDKKRWLMINPTTVLNYENGEQFMLVDIELGSMLDDFFGTQGHSAYLRPSMQIGTDRPADYSVEIGYKVVW